MGTRSYEFGKRLVAAGHEVTILCGCSHLTDVPDAVDGMRIIQIPITCSNRDSFLKRAVSFILFSLRATWQALRLDYDVVYATSTPLTVGIPALAAKWFRGKKFIFEVRDLWPELPRAMGIITNTIALSVLDWFEGQCYANADACVGLSPGIVDGIKRKQPDVRTALIPNGCDLDVFKPSPLPKDVIDLPGIQKGDFVALFCGAHGRANGLDAVLDVAELLTKRSANTIKFVFVGDGQLKPHLQARAEVDKLENCIFVDPMPKEALAKLMASCDIGLMILADVPAFQYGTSPNKFFDYISAGLPVCCNYPGWITDMLDEWQCGVSPAVGDANAFAEALLELSRDPERVLQYGLNSRKLAETEFDRDELFKRLNELLDSVVCEGSGAGVKKSYR